MQEIQTESLYSKTSELLKNYRSERFSSSHIKRSFDFSESIVSSLKSSAELTTGQLFLYKRKQPYIVNLTFNTSLLTALLCIRHHVNESCAQQLISAVPTVYGYHQAQIEKFAMGKVDPPSLAVKKEIKKALTKVQMEVWESGYQLANVIGFPTSLNGKPSRTFHRLQKLLLAAHLLSFLITPRKGARPLNFAKALKQVAQQYTRLLTPTLSPLTLFPGLIPPGATVRLRDAQLANVLSIGKDKLILVNKLSDGYGEVRASNPSNVAQIGASQPIGSNDPRSLLWTDTWQEFCEALGESITAHNPAFKLDRPPPVLLAVQRIANSEDVDVDKITELIISEPLLVEHVRTTATASNRQNIPVKEVKHGLLIHGYQRTISLLIQQALILRLSQHYFPLQEQFIQFTRLRMSLSAGLLAGDSLLADQASTLACFACSGLFTSLEFKSIRKWRVGNTKLFDIATLSDSSARERLHRNAFIMASAWGLSNEEKKAIEQSNTLPAQLRGKKFTRKLAAALGTSLILARKIYFSQNTSCSDTRTYLDQASQLLGLTTEKIEQISSESIQHCHLYCPLDA